MKQFINYILIVFSSITMFGQVSNRYAITFDNVHHHEAKVAVQFPNLQPGKVTFKIARKSLGSSITDDFARNIFNVRFTNEEGDPLNGKRVGLNEWEVQRHQGEIRVNYSIFGDTSNGVHSQFSEEQTIINGPATFMYVPQLATRPVELYVKNRTDLNWEINTELTIKEDPIYMASNLEEFMDSPILLGNFNIVSRTIESNGKKFELKLVVNNDVNQDTNLARDLLENITKVVLEQEKVFGNFPNFKNNSYTFLASFRPYCDESIVAHSNSSFVSHPESLSQLGLVNATRMLSEAFFKSWNQCRMVPIALKPFDFQNPTYIKESWFKEGFSNYYALLSLCRAGIISHEKFLEETSFIVNTVVTSSSLKYQDYNTMSQMSDLYAIPSMYASNTSNVFIPYRDYGFVIAMALDITLRSEDSFLNLDDFMSLFWSKYGKTAIGYSVENIDATLREYVDDDFSKDFYEKYMNKLNYDDLEELFESVGVEVSPVQLPYLGASILFNSNDLAQIKEYTIPDTPAYIGGLEKGDILVSINNRSFSNLAQLTNAIAQQKIGEKITVKYMRNGEEKNTQIELTENPNIILTNRLKIDAKEADLKRGWIGEEQ